MLVVLCVDSCKFLHDRSDYKSGWQLDREFEENEKPEGTHTLAHNNIRCDCEFGLSQMTTLMSSHPVMKITSCHLLVSCVGRDSRIQ